MIKKYQLLTFNSFTNFDLIYLAQQDDQICQQLKENSGVDDANLTN